MNIKTFVPLILAIVLGLGAAKLVRDQMLKSRAAAVPTGNFTKVVVTKADIQPGAELKPEDLTTADVEADKVPVSSFKDPVELAGRVAETLMVKNQPVVEAMLAPTGTGSGLQALVPQGMRAITMEVNEFSGVAGLITPGCRVDVLATINGGEGAGGQMAKAIVQNVKVTAVGQRTTSGNAASSEPPPPPSQPGEMFRSVTLLASLQDAEAIELACATGRPRLVLRGGRDSGLVNTAGISVGELRTGSVGSAFNPVALAPTPATKPATEPTTQPLTTDRIVRNDPPRRTVKVIRGGKESTVTMVVPDNVAGTAVSDTPQGDPFDSN